MKQYTAPELEILLLQETVAATVISNPNELPIQDYDDPEAQI